MMLETPPNWIDEAVCASVDPAIFFPRKGAASNEAKRICGTCPVRAECLEWALDYESGHVGGADWNASHGIYGGLSAPERRTILRKRAGEAA